MQHSADRILTTYVGSLPRSEKLLQMLMDKEAGKAVDEGVFETQVERDLDFVLRKQHEAGVDIVCDGELPRLGFSFYVKDRMSGFGGHSPRGTVTDFAKFPGYAKLKQQQASKGDEISESATLYDMPECQNAVKYDPDKRVARQELVQLFDSVVGIGIAQIFRGDVRRQSRQSGRVCGQVLQSDFRISVQRHLDRLGQIFLDCIREFEFSVVCHLCQQQRGEYLAYRTDLKNGVLVDGLVSTRVQGPGGVEREVVALKDTDCQADGHATIDAFIEYLLHRRIARAHGRNPNTYNTDSGNRTHHLLSHNSPLKRDLNN